jgi:hypothetical protein
MRKKIAGGNFSNRYFCRLNNLGGRHFAIHHTQRSGDRAWLGTTPVGRAHKICIFQLGVYCFCGVFRDAL